MERKSGACWAANQRNATTSTHTRFNSREERTPNAVPVEEDADHQPWVIRRLAFRLRIGRIELLQVELSFHDVHDVHDVRDEPRQVILR